MTTYAYIKTHIETSGGPAVKNPPANARYMGLIPGPGTKIPHALGQPSLCAALC